MKQIGNLAVVCAGRPDVRMEAGSGTVKVHVEPERGSEEADYVMAWEDDEAISRVIRELNFGCHARK